MFGEQGMMWKGVVEHYSVYCPYISLNKHRIINSGSGLHVQQFTCTFSNMFCCIAYVTDLDNHLFEKTAIEFSNILATHRLLYNADRHCNRTLANTVVGH